MVIHAGVVDRMCDCVQIRYHHPGVVDRVVVPGVASIRSKRETAEDAGVTGWTGVDRIWWGWSYG